MEQDHKKGFLAASGCAALWGILPVYWKSLVPISSSVIIIYRILLVALVSLFFARRSYSWKEIFSPLRDKKLMMKYIFAGAVITGNWSTYIWAVNSGHVIQASIGYYIEPLVVCLFGILFFHEKMTKWKGIAMGFACSSVLIILFHFGQLPGIALALAGSFAVYSAIKKTVDQPAMISLVYETLFFAPFALGIIIWMECNGKGALAAGEPYQFILLLLCGLATAVPLAMFGYAAQRTTMFVLGLCEYISPTLSLIIGIFLFKESIDFVQIGAFALIWIGLVFFSYGEFSTFKKKN